MRLCRITDSDSIAFALLRGGVGVSLHFEMYNISKLIRSVQPRRFFRSRAMYS